MYPFKSLNLTETCVGPEQIKLMTNVQQAPPRFLYNSFGFAQAPLCLS